MKIQRFQSEELPYGILGRFGLTQDNQQGGAGFDPNAAQQGNASANNDDNVVDADYEVVDDDKK